MSLDELAAEYERRLMVTPEISAKRKNTGSYYTPLALVELVLDEALQPLIDESLTASTPRGRIERLFGLTFCDPSCGAGVFLIAAARRVAQALAEQTTLLAEPGRRTPLGAPDPSPDMTLRSIREVTANLAHGVDLSESAAELCKIALWLQAMDPDGPNAFLSANIRVGNALLGTTPALLAAGIPDAAFVALVGDDKKVVAALKKRNKAERETVHAEGLF